MREVAQIARLRAGQRRLRSINPRSEFQTLRRPRKLTLVGNRRTPMSIWPASNRREFLKFLAASPLLGVAGRTAEDVKIISSPKDALNVFDFEAAARQNLPPAHFGYIATGVDDDVTLRANAIGFTRYQIRSRRLIDVSRID